MIDFATSVLGRDVALCKTENYKGSKQNILIGSVKRINGGKETKVVSCHQKLYPYLLYYCHSVPDVAVYKEDILDPKTKKKINHGVPFLTWILLRGSRVMKLFGSWVWVWGRLRFVIGFS
ncbi:hypothetical protein LWI29_008364 [Acer saccharum]|uniref:BURP domain-containing protein n=1 Tax=Acer saccharum TaxID=4024 RepID=A0AA39VB85_ACESA|nr:hypothetical protein LWI29_008364 [Acer saccharum]